MALSMSASSRTIIGFLPPSSRAKRVMLATAATPTLLPTAVEPVNETLLISGCAARPAPTVAPSPVMTLNTPAGMPASKASSARRRAVSGVSQAGLMTTVQPQARAGMSFQVVIISGKFHGTMPATTPTGSRRANAVKLVPSGIGIDTSMLVPSILVAQPDM
ncbi:hypothetical protein D9M71_664650 [compost metagenome]